ncbi:Na(+)/H(+) antiporter subunit D [Desulfolithobacter sp.]
MTANFFIHPALFFFIALPTVPLFRGIWRQGLLILVPLLALTMVSTLTPGLYGQFEINGLTLTFGRVDKLALLFANVFTLMALIGAVYGLHLRDPWQQMAAMGYVGSALGCVFAGDYLTLFLFWEGLMVFSAALIFLRRTDRAIAAGYRYVLVHVFGGLMLLGGILLQYHESGSIAFTGIDPATAGAAQYLILAGFLLNAAVPPLHAWLPDAYGSATVVGSVFMCAYTTKTAVYTLIRAFAGFEILIALGVVMALYGVVYAVLENDARRLLSYHIISQVGYMVAGVGIGTELALNGACAHAYAHILYKGLLFMGVGGVLQVTGRSRFSELGGLWKYMPWTLVFTLIGGLSISAFPLFSGFVSKSMVISGAWESHLQWAALGLTLASAGTFLHTGLKVPYFIWFWREEPPFDPPKREAPRNMLIAMGLAAYYCILIGINPGGLYRMLPFDVPYQPYTGTHVMASLQILLFTMLGFFLLIRKLYPEPKVGLDMDWFYRRGAVVFLAFCRNVLRMVDEQVIKNLHRTVALPLLRAMASLSAWTDRRLIDGFVDGSADSVLQFGQRLRFFMQPGILSRYVARTLTVLAGIILLALSIR